MPVVRCLTCGKEFCADQPHVVAGLVDAHYRQGCRTLERREREQAAKPRPVDYRVSRYLRP